MFSLLPNLKTPPCTSINELKLLELIKQPKIIIEDYKFHKENYAMAYKPHGTFSGLKESDLNKFSGYFFFEIDNLNDNEVEKNKQRLIDIGANIIYKSLSGKGLHFLIKYEKEYENKNQFKTNYEFYFKYLINQGFKLDKMAKGITRSAVIGYDETPILQNKIIKIEDIGIIGDKGIKLNNGVNGYIKERGRETNVNGDYGWINTKTEVNIPYNEQYIIKEIENYLDVKVPKNIPDGKKHNIYRKIILDLTTLNPEAKKQQITNYLSLINNKQIEKMNGRELYRFASNTYDWIKSNKIIATGRKKIVHFNKNCEFTAKEKQSIARKLIANIQTENKKSIIVNFMKDNDYMPTQKEASKALNIPLRTIQRYWKFIKAQS